MKHLKKYNESADHKYPYTWDELIYRIETDECKLQPSKYTSPNDYKKETIESLKGMLERMSERNSDINTEPIVDPNEIKDGIVEIRNFLIVFDENLAPVAIMNEYDSMNPFVFNDMVILPGRDSITCYDKSTGEFRKERIR